MGGVQIVEEGMGKHPPTGKRLHGKAVPAEYLHTDDDHEGGGGEAPPHATKGLGLVVAHAARSALERDDADAELGLPDHKVEPEGASLVLLPPPHSLDCSPEAVPVLKASAKPQAKSEDESHTREESQLQVHGQQGRRPRGRSGAQGP